MISGREIVSPSKGEMMDMFKGMTVTVIPAVAVSTGFDAVMV